MFEAALNFNSEYKCTIIKALPNIYFIILPTPELVAIKKKTI